MQNFPVPILRPRLRQRAADVHTDRSGNTLMRKDGCGADPQVLLLMSGAPLLGSYCRALVGTRPRKTAQEDEGPSICLTLFDSLDTGPFHASLPASRTNSG